MKLSSMQKKVNKQHTHPLEYLNDLFPRKFKSKA